MGLGSCVCPEYKMSSIKASEHVDHAACPEGELRKC